MNIFHDPDQFTGVSEHRTCGFHQRNPGVKYAGCTCSAFYALRPATPEEYRANRLRTRSERRRRGLLYLSDNSTLPPLPEGRNG